ncbi:MAG: phage holin family protein [Cypionkella sp.]|jgi:uncharacterized membrane protein
MPPSPEAGLIVLITQIVTSALRLLRGEAALVRAQAEENLRSAAVALALFLGAAVLGIVALNLLAAAAVQGLIAQGFAPWAASLLIAGLAVLLAVLVVWLGLALIARAKRRSRESLQILRHNLAQLKPW